MTMTYTEALRKSRGLDKTAALPELEDGSGPALLRALNN